MSSIRTWAGVLAVGTAVAWAVPAGAGIHPRTHRHPAPHDWGFELEPRDARAPARLTEETLARKRRRKKRRAASPPPEPIPTDDLQPPAPSQNPIPENLPAPPALPTKHRAVALLPIEGIDTGPDLLHAFEVALLNEIDEAPGLEGVTPNDVVAEAGAVGLNPEACDGETVCLSKVARYSRSHLAIETRIAAIAGTLNISLRAIDAINGREQRRVARELADDPKTRSAEVHRMVVDLLFPETYIGSLRITCNIKDASVFIDDKLVGTTPLEKPVAGLRAGPHILRLSKSGFSDLYRFVDVTYRRTSTISIDLETNTIAGQIMEQENIAGLGALYVAAEVSGIEIRVDGEPLGSTIFESSVAVAAGERKVTMRMEGHDPSSTTLTIEKDRRTDVGVQVTDDGLVITEPRIVDSDVPLPTAGELLLALAPNDGDGDGKAATKKPPDEAGVTWKFWTGVGLAGVGAAGFGVATYFAGLVAGLNDKAAAENAQAAGFVNRGDLLALQTQRDLDTRLAADYEIAQFVSWGVGGAVAAAGLSLLLWDLMGGSDSPPPVEAAVSPNADGAQGTLLLRW